MKDALNKSISSSWMIIKLVVPFALGIDILNYFGIINNISFIFEPIINILGLPSGVALAIAAGFFFNLYAGIGQSIPAQLTGLEFYALNEVKLNRQFSIESGLGVNYFAKQNSNALLDFANSTEAA